MSIPPQEAVAHYRLMLLIRRFEERLADLFSEGVITGTSHFCVGQEACAVGAVAALQPDDLVTSNHRGHGHFLAKGADPGRLLAELSGKATGYSGGRGGSQHMADFSLGFLGSNGITGGMIPIATGAALAQKRLGTGRVVLCFFSDGASGTGAFHEAVNMGAIWDLPIVYLLENNAYAMSTPTAEAFRVGDLAERAVAYGIPGVSVDGNDYFAVREAAAAAVARARAGAGPTLIEAKTYRCCGHSKSDRREYCPVDELAHWQERDPLRLMRQALEQQGLLDEARVQEIAAEVESGLEAAAEFARSSPDPDPTTAAQGVFAGLTGS
ncbi:thiamine pyrophosphate-dependent dehydrogenase E1 component subunit alpha [bacterium]|nr:thiamine pyrophosphate-dependent dehydrogenase E1 component subunit alpha [bacterium]